MLEKLIGLIAFSNGDVLLSILVLMILFFFIITFFLFLFAVIMRIMNKLVTIQDKYLRKNWDMINLLVMHDDIHPFDAYKKLKKRNSLRYLFYLEEFVDLLKGKEKNRLLTLGRMCLKNVYRYLNSKSNAKIIYGIHLIGIFHPEEQYKFLTMNNSDMNMVLTAIREINAVNDIEVKEELIRMLFKYPDISYIYISNLLVEMGTDIIPFLRQVIKERYTAPSEQMIAIETVRRMHYMNCLDLSDELLRKTEHPGVLACWLRYMEAQKDENQLSLIKNFIEHPHSQVRTAAVRAYLAMSSKLDAEDVVRIFNDNNIMVPINAAEIIEKTGNFPYLSTGSIENLRWKDIYKEILV